MKQKIKSADEYIQNSEQGREILIILRQLVLSTGLKETIKWGIPVYTDNNRNVVGIASFKAYTGLWFYQGALLTDKHKVLVSAQDSTKYLRQWRFHTPDEIDEKLVLLYIHEAIKCTRKS